MATRKKSAKCVSVSVTSLTTAWLRAFFVLGVVIFSAILMGTINLMIQMDQMTTIIRSERAALDRIQEDADSITDLKPMDSPDAL